MTAAAGAPAEAPWLVVDTAAPMAVVGVVRGAVVVAEERLAEPRRHAEGLSFAVQRALLSASTTMADLGGVGAGVGPGSFIGVRIGLSLAKGIAVARRVPLLGLPTLLALAHDDDLPDGDGVAILDAKRGELYAQRARRLRGVADALGEPFAAPPADVAAACAGAAFVVGAGLAQLPAIAGATLLDRPGPSAAGLARLLAARRARGAVDEGADLVPQYGRPPDAKLPSR